MKDQIIDFTENKVAIPVDKITSRWKRFVASMLDTLLLIGIYYGLLYSLKEEFLNQFILFYYVLSIFYKPIMEYSYGATLGKLLLKMKVVNFELQPISFLQSLLRSSLLVMSTVYSFYKYLKGTFYGTGGLREVLEYSEIDYIKQSLFLLFFVSALFVLLNKKNQGLHDLLAKTYVINKTK